MKDDVLRLPPRPPDTAAALSWHFEFSASGFCRNISLVEPFGWDRGGSNYCVLGELMVTPSGFGISLHIYFAI